MLIVKFFIPASEWVSDPENPSISYRGCVAACIAGNVAEARSILEQYAAINGFDVGWLRVAKVAQIPIMPGAVIAWAQV